MWDNKKKALTFSFDDSVLQDIRLIKILDKYGLKATFNLNSALLGTHNELIFENNKRVKHDKISPNEIKNVYKNHEVAVHTLSHPFLPDLDENTIIYQVEQDRLNLEALIDRKVIGMAYPCGGQNNDDRVAEIIKNNTNVKYARTITSTYKFDLPTNLFRLNPSVYYVEVEKLFDLGKKFVELKTDKPQLFYIWGHSYELDIGGGMDWEMFEKFCQLISGRDDIYYCTNKEALNIKKTLALSEY